MPVVPRVAKDLVQTAEAVIAEVFPTLNDDDLQVGLSAVYEEFCEMRGDFLVELVKAFKMKKVTESILVSALRKCFPAANLSVVVAFASKVTNTMSWCRSKGKSVTSGAKTTRAALRIINKMKIWPLSPAKPSVGKKAAAFIEAEALGRVRTTRGPPRRR